MARAKKGETRASGEATELGESLPEVQPQTEQPTTESAASSPTTTEADEPGPGDGPAEPRQWGNPYKAVFTSGPGGFELGEDRRFKQVVFKFKERPEPEVLGKLKEAGYTYRAAEKSWTVPASAAAREDARALAGGLHGEPIDAGVSR